VDARALDDPLRARVHHPLELGIRELTIGQVAPQTPDRPQGSGHPGRAPGVDRRVGLGQASAPVPDGGGTRAWAQGWRRRDLLLRDVRRRGLRTKDDPSRPWRCQPRVRSVRDRAPGGGRPSGAGGSAAKMRSHGRRRRWLGPLVVVALLVGAAIGFRAATAVPRVRTATVLRSSPIADREITTANGYVFARTRASVASKSQGRLERVLVDEGDEVAAGQVLAVVEHDELDASLAEAEALLEKARRAVPVAEAELAEAEAAARGVEAALAERRAAVAEADAVLAEREASFARTADLVERQIQSGAELDRAREQRDVARAQATLAATALATAEKEVARAAATVEVLHRRLELVRQD